MPKAKVKKENLNLLSKWIPAISLIITAIIGGFTIYFSFHTTKAQEASLPQVQLLDIERRNTNQDYLDAKNSVFRISCISRIRLFNAGGEDTIIKSTTANIHIGSDLVHIQFSDLRSGENSPDNIMLIPYFDNAEVYPVKILAHSVTAFDVVQEVIVSIDEYELTYQIGVEPAQDFSDNINRQIWIDYTINFPDSNPVNTPSVFCGYVAKVGK